MIIVQLNGGLGNQMFQYAAGAALADRSGQPLLMDLSAFTDDPLRRYDLHVFGISGRPAEPTVLGACTARAQPRWKRALLNLVSRPPVRHEPHFHFDPALPKLRGPAYLEGYFQSEKYFSDRSELVRREFSFRGPPGPANAAAAEAIRRGTSVSLHVRRGDYVSNPSAAQFHGLAPLDYYKAALRLMRERVGPFSVFVFSDDIPWTRENLGFDGPSTFIDHNGSNASEDLRLMSLCDHHIIANSSFSWWGAWLNPKAAKTVIAPRRWFHGASHDTKDLIPPEWIRL